MQTRKMTLRMRRQLGVAIAAAIALVASPAIAAENDYISLNDGLWSNAASWSLGLPVAGQDVVLGHHSAANSNLTVTLDVATQTLNSVTLDSSGLIQFMIVNQNLGTSALNATTLSLGVTSPENTYNQSNGLVNLATLDVGFAKGSNTYNLSVNGTLFAGNETIGDGGSGAFFQTGGQNAIGNNLTLASQAGVSGNYTLNGGTLSTISTGKELIGVSGLALFIQNGGTNSTPDLEIGSGSGGSGTYSLGGTGALTVAKQVVVGHAGAQGIFNLTGGTLTTPLMQLGPDNTGIGTFNLSGSGTANIVDEQVGVVGIATVTQNGAAHLISHMLTIGGSSGTFNLQNGLLSAATIQLNPGGTFNQTGGAVSFNTFNQAGGAITHDLTNFGSFVYTGGTFGGRLFNEGTASVNADLVLPNGATNDGTLALAAAHVMTANGQGLDNEGTLVLQGGTVAGSGSLSNFGQINGNGAINMAGGFTNYLVLNQSLGNISIGAPTLSNVGTVNLAAGYQFRLIGGQAAVMNNQGTLNLNGAAVVGNGTLRNAGGTIAGPGLISAPFNNASGVLLAGPGATVILNTSTNGGLIRLTDPASLLNGSTITNTGIVQGQGNVNTPIVNTGTIAPIAGTLNFGDVVSNNLGGTIRVASGAQAIFSKGLAANAGVINLTGGLFDNNGHALTSSNEISGFGTLTTGGLTNTATVKLTGGPSTINGSVTNAANASFEVRFDPAVFTGPVQNNGNFTITGANVTFAGGYNEGGVTAFGATTAHFDSMNVASGGAVQGDVGTKFVVSGDLLSTSIQNTRWNTADVALQLAGSGVFHLSVTGADLGATRAGYVDNFAWSGLDVPGGMQVNLEDGNSQPGGALYVGSLQFEGGLSQLDSIAGNGMSIYYDSSNPANAYLGDGTYALAGGGTIAPVPEPSVICLMAAAAAAIVAGRRKQPLPIIFQV